MNYIIYYNDWNWNVWSPWSPMQVLFFIYCWKNAMTKRDKLKLKAKLLVKKFDIKQNCKTLIIWGYFSRYWELRSWNLNIGLYYMKNRAEIQQNTAINLPTPFTHHILHTMLIIFLMSLQHKNSFLQSPNSTDQLTWIHTAEHAP